MAPRRKSLAELVADRSFLARRHADRLPGAPLLEREDLRALQQAYGAAGDDMAREAVLVALERAVRTEAPERSEPSRLDELRAKLEEITNMPPVEYDPEAERRALERFVRALAASALYRNGDRGVEPPRKFTLREIAERVGVSPGTVSRYLDELGVPRRRAKRGRKSERPAAYPRSSRESRTSGSRAAGSSH